MQDTVLYTYLYLKWPAHTVTHSKTDWAFWQKMFEKNNIIMHFYIIIRFVLYKRPPASVRKTPLPLLPLDPGTGGLLVIQRMNIQLRY